MQKDNQNVVFNLSCCLLLQEKFFSHLNKRTCNILRLDDCGSDPLDEKVSKHSVSVVYMSTGKYNIYVLCLAFTVSGRSAALHSGIGTWLVCLLMLYTVTVFTLKVRMPK